MTRNSTFFNDGYRAGLTGEDCTPLDNGVRGQEYIEGFKAGAAERNLGDPALNDKEIPMMTTGTQIDINHIQKLATKSLPGAEWFKAEDLEQIPFISKAAAALIASLTPEVVVQLCALSRANTQQDTERDSTRLHGDIMNLPCTPDTNLHGERMAYKRGHRDARHAAAELAIGASIRQPAIEFCAMGYGSAEEVKARLTAGDWHLILDEDKAEVSAADCWFAAKGEQSSVIAAYQASGGTVSQVHQVRVR